jgi:transcriptional regulator with XRE-family HTH domain
MRRAESRASSASPCSHGPGKTRDRLSRAELARRAGVPASTLRGWENGRGFPAMPAALRLAGALGVPVERFAEGVVDPTEEGRRPAPEKARRRRKGNAR